MGCGGETNVGVYHFKRVSQLLMLIKSEIALKFFGLHLSKNFKSSFPSMGPKFQFLRKVFPTTFLLTKHVSQHFTLIKTKKSTKIFSTPSSKNFPCVCPPSYEGQKFFFKNCILAKKIGATFFAIG